MQGENAGASCVGSGEMRATAVEPEGLGAGLRIEDSGRKDWKSIAFIRAGGMFSAPSLMVGAVLGMGLALPGAAAATLLGYGFVVFYMSFISMQAADLGMPTVSLAASSLGRAGARYLVSLLVGIVTIGWFGVQTAVCGASLAFTVSDLFGVQVPVWACSVALGALMLATALLGFDGLKWLSSLAAPFLMLVCLYGVAASVAQAGSIEPLLGYVPLPQDAIGFIAGVNMAVGLFAFGGATAADFSRFARSRKDAVLSCVVGVMPAALVAVLAGASLAIVSGIDDVAVLMGSIGLPAVGLVALVLSAWTVNAGNVYSAGLGFAVMLGRDEGGSKLTTLIAGAAGIVFALAGILDQFQAFLTVLSACGPVLAGVMMADYWLVRKGRPENVRSVAGASAPGMIALACGFALALAVSGFFPRRARLVRACRAVGCRPCGRARLLGACLRRGLSPVRHAAFRGAHQLGREYVFGTKLAEQVIGCKVDACARQGPRGFEE